HDITAPNDLTGNRNTLAVDPHVPRLGKPCRRRARTHQARVPQPFVYTLAVQAFCGSAPLLGVRLQLGLKRCELGKRRVWIGCFGAALLVAAPFEIFGAQFGIALRTVAASRTIRPIAP